MRTLAVLAVLLSFPTDALSDAERRCTRAKVRSATEYVRVYYDCYADAAAAGAEPDFACLTAATNVVRTLVAAADSRGPCPGTPDEVANAICVPFLAAGDPACRAAKFRAVAWKFGRRLACHGDGLRRGLAPRPGGFARVETRFLRRIARADALGTCGGSADQLEAIVDRCALGMATALSCGNGRLDYGEICEGVSEFCAAASCQLVGGACCVTAAGCFQFGGPIENCFFGGGLDVQPGFCTTSGCVADVPLSATPLCCQRAGAACTDAVATSATELGAMVGACNTSGLAVVGTCGADGRCVAASAPPEALSTTTTTTTSTTVVPGTTITTTIPSRSAPTSEWRADSAATAFACHRSSASPSAPAWYRTPSGRAPRVPRRAARTRCASPASVTRSASDRTRARRPNPRDILAGIVRNALTSGAGHP
jgi:hypothetical protein